MLFQQRTDTQILEHWRRGFVAASVCLLFSGLVAAQDFSAITQRQDASLLAPFGAPPRALFPGPSTFKASPETGLFWTGKYSSAFRPLSLTFAQSGVRHITLQLAQQQAAQANNPLVRLAELQVEAAKQHRLGARGDYFPKVSGTLLNMHLSQPTGQVLSVTRPLQGATVTVPITIIFRDLTALTFGVTQPITPLFQVHQLVKLAQADENIARAKAGIPIAEAAAKVEKTYFALLIAQRELTIAEVKAENVQYKSLSASTTPALRLSAEQERENFEAEKILLAAKSSVKELSTSLNELLGWPEDTVLDLAAPEPLTVEVSFQVANQTALASNPEVVEAEQTLVKARAGHALSKMEYLPVVAAMGGWVDQHLMAGSILPQQFGYIGFVATYNVFDGGKREHGVKERSAQVQAAELAVQLTKAKVAASVKKAYFELDRARNLNQLAQRMASASRLVNASYQLDGPEVKEATATLEVEIFKTELAYREAFSELRLLMGEH